MLLNTVSLQAKKAFLEASIRENLTICGLTGPVRILQKENGHRHSIDDAVTAWYALRQRPTAHAYLDLGCGIGSLGLIVLHGLPQAAHMTAIEAQDVSFQLLLANVQCNGLQERVTAIHDDLRNLNLHQKFDLITGSPPYFPVHAGTLPRDSQKAYARFELRGNLGDYALIAQKHLAKGGVFVYCFPYQQKQRGMDLVQRQGFQIESTFDVIPTLQSPPLFSVFAAVLHGISATLNHPPLIVEGEDGRYSSQMLELQATRGFGPQGTNF